MHTTRCIAHQLVTVRNLQKFARYLDSWDGRRKSVQVEQLLLKGAGRKLLSPTFCASDATYGVCKYHYGQEVGRAIYYYSDKRCLTLPIKGRGQ